MLDYVKEALQVAAKGATEAVSVVRESLGQTVAGSKPRLLTPKAQLERFMAMKLPDLEALQQRHGEASFNRYLVRMRQLADEVI